MTLHQTVNLRSGGLPIAFGDSESRANYEREVLAAARTQRVRFAVAPRVAITTPSGQRLEAGAEVTVALLHGGVTNAWQLLQGWLQTGHVIEADNVAE